MTLPDLFKCKIGVIGLGYVGLPLATEFAKQKKCNLSNTFLDRKVVGFDIKKSRIEELKRGFDRTKEISKDDFLNAKNLTFSNDIEKLNNFDVFIITVPTPITEEKLPDLKMIIQACEYLNGLLKKRKSEIKPFFIFESTFYPGATEEICIPILQRNTNYELNKDFYCGYSPERINPGDKSHKLIDIRKITSGSNQIASDWIDKLYGSIINAGTYQAKSIKVAEAAKVIENTQRDINIALMNELAMLFSKMSIDTLDVLDAAASKWNFIKFQPGLVGGHCIGVDPYYLKWKAEQLGYQPAIITAGRKVNESMHIFIAEIIKNLMKKNYRNQNILILGYTFKENCPDIRNTKIYDLFLILDSLNVNLSIYDPIADFESAQENIKKQVVSKLDQKEKFDIILVAVKHNQFSEILNSKINTYLKKDGKIIDIKGVVPRGKNVIRI